MWVRLAVAALVNRVFINVPSNMGAGARRINMGILLTNCKLQEVGQKLKPKK